ncbi:MAG: ABC transporter permease [Ignavibacteriae bacterium]|nr:ABC transporter permease [Ignavibacteriota bacterium]
MHRLLELGEGLRIAFAAIVANKMRSVLTTLGIVIGIVVVTLMATVIEGLGSALDNSIKSLGADVYYVSKWDWFSDEWWKSRNRRDITLLEARQLKDRFTLAEAVVPVVQTWQATMKYGNRSVRGNVLGTEEAYVVTSGVVPQEGRFFNDLESNSGRPVCVIGHDVADNLFEKEDPIGKFIKIGGFTYRVIGVLEKEGDFLGTSMFSKDTQAFIPLNNFLRVFGGERSFDIHVKMLEGIDKEEARTELIGAFRKIRRVPAWKEDDFGINTQEFLKSIFDNVVSTIGIIGFLITSLSLLVGGVGIMNIMFVSVKERTKEIGTRKALGARRRTILTQFLIEAAALCLIGGLIGLGLSYPLSLIIDKVLPSSMPLWVVGLSLTISITVGLISGIVPAYTAARMNPVDALRYE